MHRAARLLNRCQRQVKAAFWLVAAAVVVLSLLPRPIAVGEFEGSDKAGHFLAYLALGLLLGLGWQLTRTRPLIRAFLSLLLLGALIELAQGLLPIARTCSALDLLADALGAGPGLMASAWFWRRQ